MQPETNPTPNLLFELEPIEKPKPKRKNKPGQGRKVTPPIIKHLDDLQKILSSKSFGIGLLLLLTIGQIFHTSYVLYDLTSLWIVFKVIFAFFTAIGIDLIVLNLVARGSEKTAIAFGFFYFMINMYAYNSHSDFSWSNGKMYFSLVPSAFIPLAMHTLAVETKKD